MPITQRLGAVGPAAIAHATPASSFRDLLFALDLDDVEGVLDVGAGGFCGETTTVHLLERCGAPGHGGGT